MTYSLDEALLWAYEAKEKGEPLSIGLVGNAVEVHHELLKRGVVHSARHLRSRRIIRNQNKKASFLSRGSNLNGKMIYPVFYMDGFVFRHPRDSA